MNWDESKAGNEVTPTEGKTERRVALIGEAISNPSTIELHYYLLVPRSLGAQRVDSEYPPRLSKPRKRDRETILFFRRSVLFLFKKKIHVGSAYEHR